MRRWLSLLPILFALVAVMVPSVAIGSRGFSAHPTPLLILQSDGHHVAAPCKLTGSRHLVCRSDLGVLPTLSFVSPPLAVPMPPATDDLPGHAFERAPRLPPPRLA